MTGPGHQGPVCSRKKNSLRMFEPPVRSYESPEATCQDAQLLHARCARARSWRFPSAGGVNSRPALVVPTGSETGDQRPSRSETGVSRCPESLGFRALTRRGRVRGERAQPCACPRSRRGALPSYPGRAPCSRGKRRRRVVQRILATAAHRRPAWGGHEVAFIPSTTPAHRGPVQPFRAAPSGA